MYISTENCIHLFICVFGLGCVPFNPIFMHNQRLSEKITIIRDHKFNTCSLPILGMKSNRVR